MHNHADIVAEFEPGERLAQVVFQKFESPQFKEVFDLDVTETNQQGLASTEAREI